MGISFGDVDNRGAAGLQSASNLVISTPAAAPPTPAATPSISVPATPLSFGSVTVGQSPSPTQTVTVSNSGGSTLNVTAQAASQPAGGFTLTSQASFQVAAGGSSPVTVQFAPTAAGAYTGTLTLASNDPVNPIKTISLSGTGVAAAPAGPSLSGVVDSTTSTKNLTTAGSQDWVHQVATSRSTGRAVGT